jgi:hypothetical protein
MTNKDFNRWRNIEKIEEIKKNFRVNLPVTKEEEQKWQWLKEGAVVPRDPVIPNNPKEAFELFKNYYATLYFEEEKYLFESIYKVWNVGTIQAELKNIEDWIKEAEKIDIGKVYKKELKVPPWEFEFIRLKNDFYQGFLMAWEQCSEDSHAAFVYGRYFLFYDYLKTYLKKLTHKEKEESLRTLQTNYSPVQLKILYDQLIQGRFIKTAQENDFIYFFSGNPLINLSKIHWIKSKKMLYYLLQKICINFSLPTANNCIKTNYKLLDYNDKPLQGYRSIDEIIKTLRVPNATS